MWIDASGDLITRGDANDVPDSTPVTPGQVVGVARIRVPFLGLLALWANRHEYGRLLTIGLTIVGLGWLATIRGPQSPA